MNLCDCGEDFGSLSAFDAHRVGKHTYTVTEGLRREPPVEDGRRCLATWELEGMGWRRDQHGRWRTSRGDAPKTWRARTETRRQGKSGVVLV